MIIMSLFLANNGFANDFGGVAIHGFISQGFMQSSDNNFLTDTENGSFEFNEMGLNFSTFLTDNLKVGLQFFSRDLGEVGNDEIVIDYAFAEYAWRDWLGLRVGKIKPPSGFHTEYRDMDMLRTWILLPQGVYDEWFRDANSSLKGFDVFGNIDMNAGGILQYQAQVVNVQVATDSGTAQYLINISGTFQSIQKIDVDRCYLAGLEWITPLEGLRFKISGYMTKAEYTATFYGTSVISDVKETRTIYYSGEYTLGNFTLTAELKESYRDSALYDEGNSSQLTHPSYGAISPIASEKDTTNYYVSAAYRFFDRLELGAYYSEKINDDDGSGPGNELEDITIAVRYDINPSWCIKLEGHKMDGLFGVSPNEDGTIDEDWYLYLTKISYLF